MAIGSDIKEVLREVGNTITIKRDSGDITGEYTMYKPNAQVTKPFIREFFLEGWLSYDTQAVVGDIVEFPTTGDRYIVMNSSPVMLENIVWRYDAVFYKTNEVADILRPSEGNWPTATYHRSTDWTYVKRQVDLLITTPLYGAELESDQQLGQIGLEIHEMYVPTSIGVEALDRIRISSNIYYQVETVKPRRYNGVDVVELGEDSREQITTTSTTTTTTTTTA
jgi:hypothetical protein